MNQEGRKQKSRLKSRQYAEHTKLYSKLIQAQGMEPLTLIAVGPQQRGLFTEFLHPRLPTAVRVGTCCC